MDSIDAAKNMTESSAFPFACHDALPCFTQCCKDVNIYLTPYDVLRLRQGLSTGSTEFLARYTRGFLARATSIPVVQLTMNPGTLSCPFVTEEGCQVYENRPWACRMFPLDITSTDTNYRLITGNERCKGLSERSKGSVKDWLESQGVIEYAEMDREFQSVMPARFRAGVPMNEGLGRLLFIAYDLDIFAELVKDNRFVTLNDLDENMLGLAAKDSKELLKLAFRYIRAQMDELYQLL